MVTEPSLLLSDFWGRQVGIGNPAATALAVAFASPARVCDD